MLKGGKPIYHIRRRIDELDYKEFKDDTEIIYVNGEYRAKDALGWLIHDFYCSEPSKMHYKELAELTAFFKEKPEGVGKMCKVMEELVNEVGEKYREEGRAEGEQQKGIMIALKLLKDNFSIDDVVRITELPLEMVQKLAHSV